MQTEHCLYTSFIQAISVELRDSARWKWLELCFLCCPSRRDDGSLGLPTKHSDELCQANLRETHTAAVAVVSSFALRSPRTISEGLNWKCEQEFTAHFPLRNAKPLVSYSLHMQSTSLEDLQLYFHVLHLFCSPCYPVSREMCANGSFNHVSASGKSVENHQLYYYNMLLV